MIGMNEMSGLFFYFSSKGTFTRFQMASSSNPMNSNASIDFEARITQRSFFFLRFLIPYFIRNFLKDGAEIGLFFFGILKNGVSTHFPLK